MGYRSIQSMALSSAPVEIELNKVSPEEVETFKQIISTLVTEHFAYLKEGRIAAANVFATIKSIEKHGAICPVSLPLHDINPFFEDLREPENIAVFKRYEKGDCVMYHLKIKAPSSSRHALLVAHHKETRPAELYVREGNADVFFSPAHERLVVGIVMLHRYTCLFCNTIGAKKKCSRCLQHGYKSRFCDQDCFKQGWAAHKQVCKK